MQISPQLLERMVAHARSDASNEVCGVVAVRSAESEHGPARAVAVHQARNIHGSPLKFEIDGKELLALSRNIEDEGLEIGAIYHSHVRSEPYPSQTDINFAAGWPGVEWVIVGLADVHAPKVRSFLIDAGKVREVELEPPPGPD